MCDEVKDETEYLLSSIDNATRLLQSVAQIRHFMASRDAEIKDKESEDGIHS